MKKTLLALAIAAIGLSATAQTNYVYSRNAVGYQKFDVPKGGLTMIRPDFRTLNGGILKSTNLFERQLPVNTKVIYFDGLGVFGSPGYVVDNMGAVKFSTNITYTQGMGFWLQIPPTATTNAFTQYNPTTSNFTFYIMGEVPDSVNMGSTQKVVAVAPYLSQLGYPFPVPMPFTNTTLAKSARPNDKFIFWDGTGYVSQTRGAVRWGTNVTTVLQPGQGFYFVRTNLVASTNWTEVKPYTWPQ